MNFHSDWSDDEKISELTELQPMYIRICDEKHDEKVAVGTLNELVGFCCYQIDFDGGDEEEEGELVVYLYELQIAKSGRGKGLGSALMNHVESIAEARGIRVVF
jgi:GNAT superfamily N-acetyltransferase